MARERKTTIATAAARAAFATALVLLLPVLAQTPVRVSLEDVAKDAAFGALAKECYDAGMFSDMASDSILDCTAILEERSTGDGRREIEGSDADDDRIVMRHRVRFTAIERGGELSVMADAWTEIEELGTVIEAPITTAQYLRRVEAVLADVGARLRAPADAAPPWAGRYESEQALHLAAHLRAVSYCDRNLASMTAESLGRQLESIGIRPLREEARDRCEQLYQHLLEWGLARGNAEPTPEEYARERASLPPEQRACSGRLALDARCG